MQGAVRQPVFTVPAEYEGTILLAGKEVFFLRTRGSNLYSIFEGTSSGEMEGETPIVGATRGAAPSLEMSRRVSDPAECPG